MIKITTILLESLRLVETSIGERIFDSLSMLYSAHRGSGPFIQELRGLDKMQLDSVLSFMKEIGFGDAVGPSATPQAITRAITDAVASSSSSSSSRNDFSRGGDEEEDDDEPQSFTDQKTGLTIRKPRPDRDDPAASERHLAGQIGYRGRSEDDE